MKKILIIGSLVIAFVIAGCSEKADVEVDGTTTQVSSDGTTTTTSTSGDGVMTGSSSDSDNAMGGNVSGNELHSVYFAFDKFNIEGDRNIQTIKTNSKLITDSVYEVRVEGNTDEWGSDEYNYALGLKRASSVKDALVNNDVPVNKIKLVSYGESKPRCTEKTKECWRENRRVDFVLIPNAQ
ncbi:hypothetical protein CCY99_05230 [Helicobacter sp. 16-1353]|uniref:OmpA family protein n=1 Tax=Helicobacter sp. 16-1353 TaxID=2004996 RepID=UPI000DCE06A4|nr:OmpA family protein [Helicobacter sp. 16-1353]RAX54083.1 hypothetical protein CCY99_05230 [Helicobacter sp. 16-1353]